jgi:aryl-alcohol dehydrogenase-like predicted oxidoreductase
MLTGRLRSASELGADDARHGWPRFYAGNFERNLELVTRLVALATEKGVTPPQLALAWLLAQRPWIVPIPGTKRVAYLEENAAAAGMALGEDDLARLAETVPRGAVSGDRYPPERMPNWTSPRRR